ncbi:MAG: transporter substrate-binding domain-containing protein, partial [Rhodanobacteraceae bacterium]
MMSKVGLPDLGTRRILVRFALIALVALAAHESAFAAEAESAPVRKLTIANKAWTGDFDAAIERRMIRVLVPYSRSLYFNDKGRERGLTADVVREFERYINQKYQTGKRPVTLYLVPTTRDKLLQSLVDGNGDIAAGNLTVTPEREAIVDFVVQGERVATEVVVTGAKAAPLDSIDALGGRTVYVRRSSSYYDSLAALNETNKVTGKPEIKLQIVPDALEDEDMMEMANAGLIDVMIVDDWKAKLWAQVLTKIVVHKDLAIRSGGRIGWAVRKNSPQFDAAIQDFFSVAKKSASYEYRVAQAMRRVKQIKDPTQAAAWKKFQAMLALFTQYGQKYSFDPLMLAAQGYQESQLNQAAKSHVGAIGVMQLMPAT